MSRMLFRREIIIFRSLTTFFKDLTGFNGQNGRIGEVVTFGGFGVDCRVL